MMPSTFKNNLASLPTSVIDSGSIWFEESSVGATLYPPARTLGPRIQAYIQLVFVHFGDISLHIDKLQHHFKANTVGLLLPGHEEYFEFAREQETLHSYIHIHPNAVSSDVQQRLSQLRRNIPLSRAMENLIHQAITSHQMILSTRNKIFEAMAFQMLWRYVGEAEALGLEQHNQTYERIPKAQLFIHDHLAENLDLAKIAKAVHLSKPQLTRLFNQELGITPMAYVWQKRTAAAVEMLKHSGLSIDDIAERCGFASRYHLSRRVKEMTELAPGELRHQYWRTEYSRFHHDTK
jgi:AraC-like DNA-binding protein